MLRQSSLRLLLVFLASLALIVLLVLFFYRATALRARAAQANMLTSYWTLVLENQEKHWQQQAHHIATRPDLSRFLQQAPDSWAEGAGFLQSLGEDPHFATLIIRTRDRRVLFAAEGLGHELAVLDCQTLPWCYDAERKRLYRVYSELVWAGSMGMVVLELWRELDDALLAKAANPDVSLQLLWQNTVVARSPGAATHRTASGGYSDGVGGVIPLPDAGGFGPALAVESRALTIISARELAGASALALAGVVVCMWIALGMWQLRLARRLMALAEASRRFVADYRDTPDVCCQLERARTASGDEIDAVANALTQLTRAVVERDGERQEREARLAGSEARLREIAAVVGVGLFVVDAQHRFSFANVAAETLLGWEPGELLGRNAHEAMHSRLPAGKHHDLEHCLVHQALQTGEPGQSLAEWLVRKDGTLFPASMSVRTIRHDQLVTGAVVAFVDETQRRDMEESLRRSEERLRLAMAAARIGVWHYEATTDALHWNPEAAAFFGASSGSTQGSLAEFLDPIHPADRPLVHEALRAAPCSQDPENAFQVEYRILGRDGEERWILLTGKRCLRTAAGLTRLRGAAVDITESRRAAERYEAIIRTALDGFLLVDLQGRIIEVNEAYCQLTGYSRAELLGMGIADVEENENPSETVAHFRQIMSKGSERFETRHRGKDGSLIELEVSAQYLAADQRICSFVRDNTARRLVEETLQRAARAAEAASRAKTEFLAAVSHEIRTPMNAIMGLSYLAVHQNPGPRPAEHLQRIQTETRRLLGIVNDILDYSRSEAGRLALESVPFILDDVFAATDSLMRPKAEEKDLELSFVLPSPPLPTLDGDPSRLGQVLRNLIDNAIKFTDQGSVRVSVHELAREPGRLHCEFRVADTGIGMDASSQSWLFDTFSQGDASTSRRYGGLGLGLAISRRLVQMMGGAIRVKSEPGQGSVFSFTAWFGLARESGTGRNNGHRRVISVLVADEDAAQREELSRQLAAFGFAVYAAVSSAECLDVLEHIKTATGRCCELLLLHRLLPDMGGEETAQSVLDRCDPEARPAIFLLVDPADPEADHGRTAQHIEGVLSRPAPPEQLFEIVMKVFGRRPDLFGTPPAPLAPEQERPAGQTDMPANVGPPPDPERVLSLIRELNMALTNDTYIDEELLDALAKALAGGMAGRAELTRLRRAVLSFSYDTARSALLDLIAALGLSPQEVDPA